VDLIDTALGLGAIRQGDVGFIAKASASVNNTVLGALCSLAGARVAVAAGKQAWPTTPAATTQSAAQGRPSVLATVMVMQELRALQQATGLGGLTCNGVSVNVATMQTEAQAWLIDQQNGDGGFGEQRTDGTKGVSNLIVSALAYRALINQPVPAQPQVTNVLNWLLSQQDGVTGSWHADPLVTAQVLAVLPMAAGAELVDTDHDGLTDVVEARLGSNPSVADSRGQLGNATIAAAGINMPGFIAHATTWQPFSYNLSGGTSYSVGAGTLPPGLSLNPANGLISGTPTEPGSFSFDYDVASGIGKQTLIGRIDVSGSPLAVEDGDVPLPAWALGLLGVGLAGALRRSQKSR
jgi:MYXO-CTERM domain-containing protein